jgi:uncharacterized membrane protein (UPF0182 family)
LTTPFLIQAQLYRAYHMVAPEVFYNREDLWQFPRELVGMDGGSAASTMPPYYTIMRLPGDARAEFILMLPMVPSQRENMIAWLAARCDPSGYGKLIVYTFPKDKLVYGPFQIEARIQQNTDLAADLAVEPDRLTRHSRSSRGRADRELDPLRFSALFARGVRSVAGVEAGDCRLW